MKLGFPQLFHESAVSADVLGAEPVNKSHLTATSDAGAVASWLRRFHGSAHTFNSSRKEAERFLLWLGDLGLTLRDIRVEHLSEYIEFLRNPQPAERWVGPPCARHLQGVPNPLWRPFAGPLAPSSSKLATTILFGLFEYLVTANYLQANLWRLLPRQKAHKNRNLERYLPHAARDALFSYVRMKVNSPDREVTLADFRDQWLVSLFYLSGARRSEVAKARMSDVFRDDTGWWWRIFGKGGVIDEVPLAEDFVRQMTTYRIALGMGSLPSPLEKNVPLVGDVYGGTRPLTPSSVYKLIKAVCLGAAEVSDDPFVKATLLSASPHWLRHTAASDQLNEAKLGLATVSRNLRHSDISTTSRYLHVDREQRHSDTQRHVLPGEDK